MATLNGSICAVLTRGRRRVYTSLRPLFLSLRPFACSWGYRNLAMAAMALCCVHACGTSDVGEVGDGVLSVKVVNRCDAAIYARAGGTPDDVTDPELFLVVIPPGDFRAVSIVTNVAYNPSRYLIGLGLQRTELTTMKEFELDVVKDGRIQIDVAQDCSTMTVSE